MATGRAEFGSLLRIFRSRALLSQEALAERAAMSVRAIRDLERGRVRQPHASTLGLLIRALGLSDVERELLTSLATASDGGWSAPTVPPAPELIGRDALLKTLSDRTVGLRPGEPLVITGRPGVGKTALALALAHGLGSERFTDGILFVPLQGMSNPVPAEAALRSILRACGVSAPAGTSVEDLAANARFLAADRRVLFVLDDAANESQVRPLLVGGPSCRIVVTSRGQLSGLESADRFVLHGLSRRHSIELLRRVGAAGESSTAYEVVADACDDLPLALRIAASKLAARQTWSVEDLAIKLTRQRRLDVLAAGDRDVRSSIKLSVDGLTDQARTALSCMASCGTPVVPDWFGATVAGMSMREFSTAVEELVDASLVDSLGFDGGVTERLRLHDLIREFAGEAAGAAPSPGAHPSLEHEAVARAVDALLRVLVPADARADQLGFLPAGPLWRATRDALPHRSQESEHDVEDAYTLALVIIRRGCQLGLATATWPLALAATGLQDRRGLLTEWRQTHELVLEALTRSDGDAVAVATIAASVAGEQLSRGTADEAVATFEHAARLAAALHNRDAELWARAGGATALHYAGRSADARTMLEEVAAQARTDRAPDAQWQASLTLAQLLLAEGSAADAIRCLDEAEQATAFSLPPLWLATFRFEAARCHLELGDLAQAERALDDALRVFRDIASPVWEAAALRQVGRLQERRAQYEVALRTFQECLQVFESVGDLRWAGWVLGDIARLHVQVGDRESAKRSLHDARSRLRALGDQRGLARLEEIEARASDS